MFGGNDFRLRKRLADLVMRVSDLADRTAADKRPLFENGVATELRKPLMLVVCGQVNAGKSTLINQLIGRELCETNSLPETKTIRWYRYGDQHHDHAVSSVLSECSRPYDVLVDINPVDTPGCDSEVQHDEILAGEFFPMADLVLWVFPAKDPWTASTWNAIGRQDAEVIGKSVFVLQQADLCAEKDIPVIMGHVRDLSAQRVGRVLPVFPVSINDKPKASSATQGNGSARQESGASALENHISEMMSGREAEQELLRSASRATMEVLQNIEEKMDRQSSQLHNDEIFLREIEDEIDELRAEHMASEAVMVATMRQVFMRQVEKVLDLLKRRTGVLGSLKSLFMTDSLPYLTALSLAESVKEAVELQAEEDVEVHVAHCSDHWESVRPRVKQQLNLSLGDFDHEARGFDSVKKHFVRDLGKAAKEAVVDLKVRATLDKRLAERRSGLKVWMYLVLMLLVFAGLCGVAQIQPYPYPALGLLAGAALGMTAFVFAVHRSRKRLVANVSALLGDGKYSFASSMGHHYRAGVSEFYSDYANMLEHVRCHIGTSQLEHRPHHEEWNRLFFEFKDIEYDL